MSRDSVKAVRDLRAFARVIRRTPLFYAQGADASEDRPAHVRAASSVVWFDGLLTIVQDDALFFARVEPGDHPRAAATSLPRGAGGFRLFDDTRGNKSDKLDLEAAAVIPTSEGEVFLAFSSGSTRTRCKVVVARVVEGTIDVRVLEAPALFDAMRDDVAFSGSELNVEGAVFHDGEIVFFQRGNGATNERGLPVDAIVRIDAMGLLAHLEHGAPCPAHFGVRPFDLGTVDGARLAFTDAAVRDGELFYVAVAEASPDATRDGPVSAVAVGKIVEHGASFALLVDEDGRPSTSKVEGIAPARGGDADHLFAVVDRDDPAAPAELLEIEVGFAPNG